jgi:hypothetical protein
MLWSRNEKMFVMKSKGGVAPAFVSYIQNSYYLLYTGSPLEVGPPGLV